MPSLPEVDRLSITTVVDNFIDNLRADEKVAKRFTHAQARRMPTLKAEHGLGHWVEVERLGIVLAREGQHLLARDRARRRLPHVARG